MSCPSFWQPWQICIERALTPGPGPGHSYPAIIQPAQLLSGPNKEIIIVAQSQRRGWEKKCTQMSFIEYRFTLTSLGESRKRMLNVNMNKWAENKTEKKIKIQELGNIIINTRDRAGLEECALVALSLAVSHEKSSSFWFQCHMLHVLQATIRNRNRRHRHRRRRRHRPPCRSRPRVRATSSAKLNTAQRQCRQGKILAMDKRAAQHSARSRTQATETWAQSRRPTKKKGFLCSRLLRWLISWQSWFQSANVYAVFFFFLLALGRLGACKLTRIMTLSIFGAVSRGEQLGCQPVV